MIFFLFKSFENLPNLIEASWNMETAFPLTALKREEHLSAAVQIKVFGGIPEAYGNTGHAAVTVQGNGKSVPHRKEICAVYAMLEIAVHKLYQNGKKPCGVFLKVYPAARKHPCRLGDAVKIP